jgi:hypothetical protein
MKRNEKKWKKMKKNEMKAIGMKMNVADKYQKRNEMNQENYKFCDM